MAEARMLPKEEGQTWLILPMTSLGYKSMNTGVCHAVAHIGIQEFLTNNIPEYDNTLDAIHTAYMEAIQEYSQEFYPSEQSAIPWKAIEERFLIKFNNLNPYARFNIYALFDAIEIYYHGHRMQQLFPDKESIPGVLEVESTLPLVASQAMKEFGGMKSVGAFGDSGGIGDKYRLKDISNQFETLRKISCELNVPIGISLSTDHSNHVISACFNPAKKTWTIIDANKYKTLTLTDIELTKTIISSLIGLDISKQPILEDRYITFYRAVIYTAGIHKNALLEPVTKFLDAMEIASLRDSDVRFMPSEPGSLQYQCQMKVKEMISRAHTKEEIQQLLHDFQHFEQFYPVVLDIYKDDLISKQTIQTAVDKAYQAIADAKNQGEIKKACLSFRADYLKIAQKKEHSESYDYQERMIELLDKLLKSTPSHSAKITAFNKILVTLNEDRYDIKQLKGLMKQIKSIGSRYDDVWSVFFKTKNLKTIDDVVNEKNDFKKGVS